MRLPGADYGRGMSSLGREGNGAVAQYEVAARTTLETQNAKNAVYGEFQKLGEAAVAWDQATQEAEAARALSQYNAAVTEAETTISNTKAFKADELPTDLKFDRFEKGPDGTDVPVDMVTSWKVAPQLYDHYEKQAAERALGNVTGAAREKLRLQIEDRRTNASARMKDSYFKGRMDDLRSTTQEAVTNFTNAEDVNGAISTIETAVKNGVFSVNEGRQAAQEVRSGVEAVQIDRFIGATDDPGALSKFAADIGAQGHNSAFPNLTPAQRVNAMQAAENKSLAVQTRNLAAYDRNKKDMAAQLSNDAQLRFVSTGQLPTPEELNMARNTMSPSEFRAFISIGRNSNGMAASDPTVMRATTDVILNLADTDLVIDGKQGDMIDKISFARDELSELYAGGKLTRTDYDAQVRLIDAQEAKLFDSDKFKSASKYVQGAINPSKDILGRSMNEVSAGIESMALMDMRKAVAANPKLDPYRWAEENMPKYRKAVGDKQVIALSTLGLTGYAVFSKDGTLNQAMTSDKLTDSFKAGLITGDAYEAAVNNLFSQLGAGNSNNPLAKPKP